MQSVVDSGHLVVLGGLHLEAKQTATVSHGHIGKWETPAPLSTDTTTVGAPERKMIVILNMVTFAHPNESW